MMKAEGIIKHYPVMVANVMDKLTNQYPRAVPIKLADCNLGFGGHSRSILKSFTNAQIQAYDLDPRVIEYFTEHYENDLSETERQRLTITQANFSSMAETKRFDRFNVILADFGFCSFHLETERGFSWLKDEELDMRYSSGGRTCAQIVNQSSQLEVMSILKQYGDLRGAKSIAEAIVAARPIKTTQQLKEAVVQCFQEDKTRKIAQVFQSFRIATNNEIKDIQKLCSSLDSCLSKNGLFMGITFHSLERDVIHRFVKQHSKLFSKIEIETPSAAQTKMNPKSRSAKLLTFKKLL